MEHCLNNWCRWELFVTAQLSNTENVSSSRPFVEVGSVQEMAACQVEHGQRNQDVLALAV